MGAGAEVAVAWGRGPDKVGTNEVVKSCPAKGEALSAGPTRGRRLLVNPGNGTRLGGFFSVRRGGGGTESLSEVGRRVARLNAPRLREDSEDWSLDVSERLDRGSAVERKVCVIHLLVGGWSYVSLIKAHMSVMSLVVSP